MAFPPNISAVFVVLILFQCVVCSNDTTKPVYTSAPVVQEVQSLDCINETLHSNEYEMFPDGNVLIEKYTLFLNSSSYVLKNESIIICKPPIDMFWRKFTVAFLFCLFIFTTHAQMPLVLCSSLMRRLFLFFISCMLFATMIAVGVVQSRSELFGDLNAVIAVMTFINTSVFGWLTFFSSQYMVTFLEGRHYIEITDSEIILKKPKPFAYIGRIVGACVASYYFVSIIFIDIQAWFGVDFDDRIEGEKMLVMFGLPILLFMGLILSQTMKYINRADGYKNSGKIKTPMHKKLRLLHLKYSACYFITVFMWFFGSYSLYTKDFIAWYLFIIVHSVLPIYWLYDPGIEMFKHLICDVATDCAEEDDGYTVVLG